VSATTGGIESADAAQPEMNYNLRIHFSKFAQSSRKPNLRNHHFAPKESVCAKHLRNHFLKLAQSLLAFKRKRLWTVGAFK
jgi:hypothetical protein